MTSKKKTKRRPYFGWPWRPYFAWPPKKKKKRSSCDFGRHYFKSKHVGRHFCQYFQGVCSDFAKVL